MAIITNISKPIQHIKDAFDKWRRQIRQWKDGEDELDNGEAEVDSENVGELDNGGAEVDSKNEGQVDFHLPLQLLTGEVEVEEFTSASKWRS